MSKSKEFSFSEHYKKIIEHLKYLGVLPGSSDTRLYNVGESDYSKHIIQPWSIWLDYPELTPFDCDIIKRILRTKEIPGKSKEESRKEDYEKIIHICQECLRQLNYTKE